MSPIANKPKVHVANIMALVVNNKEVVWLIMLNNNIKKPT